MNDVIINDPSNPFFFPRELVCQTSIFNDFNDPKIKTLELSNNTSIKVSNTDFLCMGNKTIPHTISSVISEKIKKQSSENYYIYFVFLAIEHNIDKDFEEYSVQLFFCFSPFKFTLIE